MMLGGNGGGSDSGFWVPQASNVAAAIGHTIAKSGGDIRDFVDAVGTIRAGIERSKENKNTKSTEIGEVIKLDDPVKEKIEGLLDMMRSDTDAAINMLNADMIRLAQRPAARANVVEITRLHAEIKKFEENRQGYHEAYRTIDKWGGLHEKTADIISAFAVTILDTFQGEQILNATSRSDNMIDTTDLQPRTVILYGTEDQQKRYGAILRLMHNSFARSVEEKHNSTLETVTPYVGFIRNEHGNAAPLNRLMEHITTGREIGIVHALDIQLGAQVIAQYGHEGLQALISCCDLILRKGSDPDIVDEVIKILGTVDVWRSNDKDPDDLLAKFGGVLLGQSGNTDNEERVTEPELKRNDIRDLNPNDAVLVHEGGTVAMIQGQPYHTNKRVKRIPMAREIGPEIVLPTGQRIRGGVLYEPGQVPAPRELNQSNKDDQPELEGNGKLAIEPVADRLALEPKRWRPAFKFGLRRAQVDPEEKEKDNDTSIDTQ
ncbi:MAG: TraM recognition domain-containing protein, partial [Candidatus Levyibacteriota bacterium]